MVTFIAGMKKLILLFSLIVVAGCTQAQNKPDIENIPPFHIFKNRQYLFYTG